ncbi:hypothetical protein KFK09_000973 [Dendrobium nobile]|uniref:Uncharacterized protein n=1 Tax=Dendrobium nobile TaxID=94219 RepID=A0A8T3CA24_DENNO|nr:hypothetical protein KFK09_000973 [Dendrobium nobile]
MDCRRRSVVDDVRSRRTRAVDEDRRRIRWAVDEDRHQRRWAIDDDRRRRRQEIDDYPPLELPLQWRDPPPEYPSLFYSASRKGIRKQPIVVDDYPPLELPLRWRDPPPEYPPLELPLKWRDPPQLQCQIRDSLWFQRSNRTPPPPAANQQPIIHSPLERSQIRTSPTLITPPDSAPRSTTRGEPQLDADFVVASSHDQNNDPDSRQCDSGPNTSPLPFPVANV